MVTKTKVVNHLRLLGKGKILPENIRCGICSEILHKEGLNLYAFDFSLWPKFSGDLHFPIPGCKGINSEEYYYFEYKTDKWGDNQYGDLRRELCLWLADYFEKF